MPEGAPLATGAGARLGLLALLGVLAYALWQAKFETLSLEPALLVPMGEAEHAEAVSLLASMLAESS